MNQQQIHYEAHVKIGAELAAIGLDLSDRIPASWDKLNDPRKREEKDRFTRWNNAVELVADLLSHGELSDGRTLLQRMLGADAQIRSITGREEAILEDAIFSIEPARQPFAKKPSLRFSLKIAGTTVFADARRKSVDGMVRRYALKDPALAQLDAMAAWLVIRRDDPEAQRTALDTVVSHLRSLKYIEVANQKTGSTSDAYRALTFQRTDNVGGLLLGEEVKVFTAEQFRSAEVDPCSDSARGRYERRRLIEFVAQLGFPCTTLWIVRHGQTQGNAEGILHGFTSSPLMAGVETIARNEGRLMATRKRPDMILSSDLPRAMDTASVLAAPFKLPIHRRVGLRERHLGDWEGRRRPTPDTHAVFAPYGLLESIPGGGESFASMASRTLSSVEGDIESSSGKELLMVTHAGPIRALLGGLDRVAPSLQWDLKSAQHLKPIRRLVPRGYIARIFDDLTTATVNAAAGPLGLAA